MLLFITLWIPFFAGAQNEGEHFWSGAMNFTSVINHSMRSNGSTSSSSTNVAEMRVNKGFFISNNRMVYAGITGGVSYYEPQGVFSRYVAGIQAGMVKYHQLTDAFYLTLGHDIAYSYGWNGSHTTVEIHSINYRLSPGVLYRMNPKFALQLDFSLVNVGITNQYYSNNGQSQRIALNLISGSSTGLFTFGLFYFPFQVQHKKH